MHNTKKLTTEEFIEKAKQVHGNKYDYSKVNYINNVTKVCIICPIHGEFWTTPKCHLQGKNCPKCSNELSKERHKGKKFTNKIFSRKKKTSEIFIEEAKQVHGNIYDYSKVEYINRSTKVCIICPIHGEFWQKPSDHLRGNKCPKCANDSRRNKFASNRNDFIEKANNIFNNLYEYPNFEYINNSVKIPIICKKHGVFYCSPNNHLKGRGCPICKSELYVYENRLFNFLIKNLGNSIEIIRQYKSEWLTKNKSIDFFIPKYNIAIEHQGAQHFGAIKFLGGEKKYDRVKELDIEKYNECCKNNIKIIYFSYEKCIDFNNFFTDVITDENKLLKIIKNYE